jgi:MerC mercury resistance protein
MEWKNLLHHPQGRNAGGVLDRTGVAVSWICIVHCLIVPFVLAAIPLWGFSFLTDKKVEWAIVSTSILIAVVSFIPAYLYRHRKVRVVLLFAGGMGTILFAGLFLEEELMLKAPFLLTGAILITAAHLLNRRLCRECECPVEA